MHAFRDEGLLPDLILYSEGVDENTTVSTELQQIASSILEKIVLEGGQSALQYCSSYELLMLMNSSNLTARMGALVMMADLNHWSVQPLYELIRYRQDAVDWDCRFQIGNREMTAGVVVCVVGY